MAALLNFVLVVFTLVTTTFIQPSGKIMVISALVIGIVRPQRLLTELMNMSFSFLTTERIPNGSPRRKIAAGQRGIGVTIRDN